MNCYLCDRTGATIEAVAICQHCGIALCRDHADEGALARRPGGHARRSCTHRNAGSALSGQQTGRTLEGS
jgi:hypothetical protein